MGPSTSKCRFLISGVSASALHANGDSSFLSTAGMTCWAWVGICGDIHVKANVPRTIAVNVSPNNSFILPPLVFFVSLSSPVVGRLTVADYAEEKTSESAESNEYEE